MKARRFFGLISVLALLVITSSGVGCALTPAPTSEAAWHTPVYPDLMPVGGGDLCPALDPPTGSTVTVATEADLRDQAYNAAPDTTILVTAGAYNMQSYVHIVSDGIALRGATGNRSDVILDFGGMTSGHFGILVESDDVTIADLTIRNAADHGVSIQGRDRPVLYNLHIQDIGDQLIKVNPGGDGSEDGLLACSRLEYTSAAPNEYTNGISAHNAHRWTVRDNEWYRIRTPGNTPVPTILFWFASSDTVVERNLLVDCYQGIAFGNASHGSGDHTGGIVRNNFIYASMPHDVVIEMVHATGWLVAHNTAILLDPASGLTWGMEARFSDSQGTFAYNLTNMDIWRDRDGAQGISTGNVTNAQTGWFVDAANADLHLVATATAAIDQAATLPDVPDDIDGDTRPIGSAPDVGADEYGTPITPTSLALTAPTGGEVWAMGSQRQIRWISTGTITHVSLTYSSDGFATPHVISSPVANTGVYTWTTPPTPTHSAQVRVASIVSPTIISDTSAVFVLYDPSTFTNTVYLPLVTNNYVSQPQDRRIYTTNLVYKGAFAYPAGDDWAYSGHALAYYPAGDPGSTDGYPGSLYAAAHTWYDLVGEITIPEPVISDNFDDLPQASVLRSPTDITGGWKDNCTYNDDCMYREVDGLEYLPNVDKIVWNLRDWYNVGGYDQDSLGWSDLDMTGAQGVWHIGERPSDNDVFHNAKTCNYLFQVPEGFAGDNLDGKWLIAGNQREAGAFGGSQGPTLYALAPWQDGNPPASGQNLDTLALLYYPEIYDCVWNDPAVCHFPGYRAADNWGGGAWVQTTGASAILIFGRKGLGDSCYGTQAECGGDICVASKGFHAYPYEPQILFYDPEELKAVLAGTKEPWEVLPYEVYSPVDKMFGGECATLGAVAHDRERGLVYVAEQQAGPSGETVVHVWRVE